jgi:hypothetical protein
MPRAASGPPETLQKQGFGKFLTKAFYYKQVKNFYKSRRVQEI